MNADTHVQQDDLALYAMHALSEAESWAIAQHLRACAACTSELAEAQSDLILVALSVERQPVPEDSRGRFLAQIAAEPQQVLNPAQARAPSSGPVLVTSPLRRSAVRTVAPWLGWAAAAGFAFMAGKLYHDRDDLHSMLSAQTGQVIHMSAGSADMARERDALKADQTQQVAQATAQASALAAQAGQIATLTAATATAEHERDLLNARVTAGTAQVAQLSASVEIAHRERDNLQSRLTAESSQLARLNVEAARARQVLDALTDQSALRVSLSGAKARKEPFGRATYVASKGELVFIAGNLAPLRPNKVYQLWVMPADGSSPVPAGTFAPDPRGNASVILPPLPQGVAAKAFGVTVENAGGSQTPTLPIVLQGA